MAAKKTGRPRYECIECGWQAPKWVGQCPQCKSWSTVEDVSSLAASAVSSTAVSAAAAAKPVTEVDVTAAKRWSTKVAELDRVLGGGVVPGAVTLLAGEPGIGKSTLLLDVAARAAAATEGDGPVLYVTGEESAAQVRLRAERIGALHSNLLLATETDLAAIIGQVEATRPRLLVVDSVQTVSTPEADGSPGGVSQVRAVAAGLISVAKARALPVVLVGHVTKDGSVAGPRVLEHLVDVVCHFEGEQHSGLRLLRAVKNRFGATDEVGCFEMTDGGIIGLADPSGLFLSGRSEPVAGTATGITLEGRRPMPVEVQALVAPASGGSPRRATSGVDSSRIAMNLAVIQARLGLAMHSNDVYVSTVGGARAMEPACDLAVILAVLSACHDRHVRPDLVAVGEVGLTGELRAVNGLERRLSEAARLGMKRALVPAGSDRTARESHRGLEIIDVATVSEAIGAALTPAEGHSFATTAFDR